MSQHAYNTSYSDAGHELADYAGQLEAALRNLLNAHDAVRTATDMAIHDDSRKSHELLNWSIDREWIANAAAKRLLNIPLTAEEVKREEKARERLQEQEGSQL